MLLVYGAYGYSGRLISELAASRGLRPILAGRDRSRLVPLAGSLGLPFRAFPLESPQLQGVTAVLHCAGPFSATSRPMVDACLAAGAHYLDITGEVDVFEAVFGRDAEARRRGVMLLPGVGFDVVASDCLAKRLHDRLPSAQKLVLAFAPKGRSSPGTAKTMIENMPHGGRVRLAGRLVRTPPAWKTLRVPFADKERLAMSIPWGDLATAYRSTGVPNLEVYVAARPSVVRAARASRLLAPLLRLGPIQSLLKARASAADGPDEAERREGKVQLWGRASDDAGSVEAVMTVPDGYSFTADAAVACAARVLAGGARAGATTPSLAFGAAFAEGLPGVSFAFRPATAAAPRPG